MQWDKWDGDPFTRGNLMDVTEIISVVGLLGAGIWQFLKLYGNIVELNVRVQRLEEKDAKRNEE